MSDNPIKIGRVYPGGSLLGRLKRIRPNRVAAVLGSCAAVLGGASVAIADMDTQSAIGVAVGVAGLVKLVDRWLVGWQAYEDRQDGVGDLAESDARAHVWPSERPE